MKKTILLFFLLIGIYSFSQNGKIVPKRQDVKPGELNTYVYVPPVGMQVPENAVINVCYRQYVNRAVPLTKKDANYEFSIRVPDSIQLWYSP